MNNQRFAKGVISSLCLYALVLMQIVFAPTIGNFDAAAQTPDAPTAIIYDNGPLQTGATSKSGVSAPAGAQFSEVQNFAGDTSSSNTNAGAGCQTIGTTTENRCADNFVVPVGETWTINQVIVFAYQTGFAGTTSPFTAGSLQIWNGPPGVAGSSVIFGDTTTNRLGSSTDTNTFRIFNSIVPPPSAPGTTRRIWQINLNVTPGLALTSGEYWIDFSLNAGATGSFSPTTTIVNARYTPLMNGRQRTGAAPGTWATLVDTGSPATAIDLPQDFPFKLDGTKTGARAIPYSRKLDFNGDNLTDFAVTRNSGTAKNWFIAFNGTGGGTSATFGNASDLNVPEDYDGDGRTDIAVWRPGTFAHFYILQSSTNTVRGEQFGQTGDDPTIVGDYDGDGKADPAVYRQAQAGVSSNGAFFYRASTAAAGNITAIGFGAPGDKPYPGDFDGDGRYDASVIRNNGGNAQIFQQRTTQGFVVTNFGLFTDRFVTADFDGDYRNDMVAIRESGGNLTWFVSTSVTRQFVGLNYGTTGDTPIPGDYDGDRRSDFGVFRNGSFFTFGTLSAPQLTPFGQTGDQAAGAYLVH